MDQARQGRARAPRGHDARAFPVHRRPQRVHEPPPLGGSEPTPETHHERARAIALLETALQKLPLASREVLLLVGVEGMEQEEVAKVLGLSYDATRQRLSRARAQLAEAMETLEKKQDAIAARRSAKRGEST